MLRSIQNTQTLCATIADGSSRNNGRLRSTSFTSDVFEWSSVRFRAGTYFVITVFLNSSRQMLTHYLYLLHNRLIQCSRKVIILPFGGTQPAETLTYLFFILYFKLDTLLSCLRTISAIFFPLNVSGLTGPSSGGLNCTCSLWYSPPENGIVYRHYIKIWYNKIWYNKTCRISVF